MKTIYKYDIMEPRDGIIEGPITKILHAGEQNGSIKVWAEVDTKAPNRKFSFIPVGTGWNLDLENGTSLIDSYNYLSTVMLSGGKFVFHVYYCEIVTTPTKKIESPKTYTAKNQKNVWEDNTIVSMINPEILSNFTK